MSAAPVQGQWILDRLFEEQRLTRTQVESCLLAAKRTSDHAVEALLDSGAVSEAELLKWLSALYQTRFVSTEKLAGADIERATLEKVPRRLAERMNVMPILFDARAMSLSVVAADLEDDVGKQVQLAAGVREVKVYVARPAAIRAAIDKFYNGQRNAFAMLMSTQRTAPTDAHERYDRAAFDEQALSGGASSPVAGRMPRRGTEPELVRGRGAGAAPVGGIPPAGIPAGGIPATGIPAPAARAGLISMTGIPAITLDPEPEPPKPPPPPPAAARPPPPPPPPPVAKPEVVSVPAPPAPDEPHGVSPDGWLETLNVLVSLSETSRADLRGHSGQVARLARQLSERMGLDPRLRTAIVAAAYLHDVGKASAYHLTALNVAEYEGHKIQAQKVVNAPLRLFEAVKLPTATTAAIEHLYEHWDGSGFPDRLAGKDIPIGARILAIAETYADLVQNARNPFRRILPVKEALDVLHQRKSSLFDPNLVDLFAQVIAGDDLRRRLEGRAKALLVDPDPEETTVLELRLVEHGWDTLVARNAADARTAASENEVDAIITEVELPDGDGFALLEALRQDKMAATVPVIFLTRRSDRESVQRGFKLGAVDYVVKPTSADVVVAKLANVKSAAQTKPQASNKGGVSGSLQEMGLPDVVQILAQGRKSGRLAITSGSKSGAIYFVEGQVHDATFGSLRSEEAVYAMLALVEGEFALDPPARPEKRTMQANAEALLLEGMRRLDEAGR